MAIFNRLNWSFFATVALFALGCDGISFDPSDDPRDYEGYLTRVSLLEGPCTVEVEGFGAVDVEEDYLPNVVACENGGAPPEALKAQAVQARGFLYYKLFVAEVEVIRNSQSDQVYRCNHRPNGAGQEHIDAVNATRGQYLVWDDRIIAPFYVAGSTPPNPEPADPLGSCNGAGGSASTERFVTYNWGRTGCDIDMSPLGWVPSDCERNPHNRGCASQNGESCLSDLGWQYQDMFRYYYGDDIELVTSTGACGGDPPVEMTEYDRWCSSRSDESYCYDAQRLVSCSMGAASSTEICVEGCEDGLCREPPSPDDCANRSDGWHCLGTAERVRCASGRVAQTEVCNLGCDQGACLLDETGVNQSNPDMTNSNPGMTNSNPGTTNSPGEEERAFPALVDTSYGVEGGCSVSTGSRGGPASVWGLFAVMLFAYLGRNRP